jgi:hypothetical protein
MYVDIQESREKLLHAGFTANEIKLLMKLRQKHILEGTSAIQATRRRLEFARWLFLTGKLTETI